MTSWVVVLIVAFVALGLSRATLHRAHVAALSLVALVILAVGVGVL